jgi:DNA-binding transcriptional ArsR family regulator
MTSMGQTQWVDPDRELVLKQKDLRGLAHPIRLRLFHMLQQDGPATASGLASLIGQSSGVTSYHLRVLAEHDFIVEDTERGNARDRYWKAPARSTIARPDEVTSSPWQPSDLPIRVTADEARELSAQVSGLLSRYRRGPDDPDPGPGTLRARFRFQLLADEAPS